MTDSSHSRNRAISSVVGVVLMVSIVVLLATVLAVLVFDIGNNQQQTALASASFDEVEGQYVNVTLQSVQNADHIFVKPTYGKLPGRNTPYLDGGGVHNDGYPDGPTYGGESSYQHYLLSGGNGGVGTTTVTMNTSTAEDGVIPIIGVVDGKESVVDTYEYTGGA